MIYYSDICFIKDIDIRILYNNLMKKNTRPIRPSCICHIINMDLQIRKQFMQCYLDMHIKAENKSLAVCLTKLNQRKPGQSESDMFSS